DGRSSCLLWSVRLQSGPAARSRHIPKSQEPTMAKVLCVLDDDRVDGYPTTYARDEIPDKRIPYKRDSSASRSIELISITETMALARCIGRAQHGAQWRDD